RAACFSGQLVAGPWLPAIAAGQAVVRTRSLSPVATRQAVVGARPLPAIAADVGPAVAAAVVLLPIAAFVAPIDLAVAAGVDVVAAGAFGERGVADLFALHIASGGPRLRLGAVAPAVVAVVDVDVG